MNRMIYHMEKSVNWKNICFIINSIYFYTNRLSWYHKFGWYSLFLCLMYSTPKWQIYIILIKRCLFITSKGCHKYFIVCTVPCQCAIWCTINVCGICLNPFSTWILWYMNNTFIHFGKHPLSNSFYFVYLLTSHI